MHVCVYYLVYSYACIKEIIGHERGILCGILHAFCFTELEAFQKANEPAAQGSSDM